MNWLQNVGDTDILRDATSASAVFWYRARRSLVRVAGAGASTALLLLLVILLALGPDRTGVLWLRREWLAVAVSMWTVAWGGYCGWLAFKFLPSRNDRVVLRLRELVRSGIEPLRESARSLGDEPLQAKTAEFKQRLAEGESLDDIRPDAYACVREASRRGLLPYDFLDEPRRDEKPTCGRYRTGPRRTCSKVFGQRLEDFDVAREQWRALQAELTGVNQLRKPLPHEQFDCQLIGGQVLYEGNVAEMKTGEGKTIVCHLAAYLKVSRARRSTSSRSTTTW